MISYKNKKITVIGAARSGIAAANLLKTLGARVIVSEKNRSPATLKAARELRRQGIEVELGKNSRSFIAGRDLIVVSPGVRLDSELCVWALSEKIEVISEIELASSICPAVIVAITGTNGKTTTTTLIGEVIKASGKKAYVLGNIGKPFSHQVLAMKPEDFVSLEVSSFQLEAVKDFHPKVAVILNLTPDHLDRYDSIAEYLAAKKRIYMNQDAGDYLVLNYGDEALRSLGAEAKSKVLFFNQERLSDFNQNQCAVLAVAKALNIKRQVCLEVFKDFKGVEHRMEFVRKLAGVEFINDSKATNIDSTVWALKNIKKPAVLIAGGRDKGSDFKSVSALVREKIKFAVLVGEASDRIAQAWQEVLPTQTVKSFEEAVDLAYHKARADEIVLFSPMCKSFDMFTDYEHRGRVFKDLVNRLT